MQPSVRLEKLRCAAEKKRKEKSAYTLGKRNALKLQIP